MTIVITGGGGFLGARLARALLARGWSTDPQGGRVPIVRLHLLDRVAPPEDLRADPRVTHVSADLLELLASTQALPSDTAAVFHLAAAVSGECEADFDLGMRSNLDATRGLLEACRRLPRPATFVYASSLAVFGSTPGLALPDPIDDLTLPTPQTSYGTQKYIGELLVADHTRKGHLRGRSVRLMTASVRAGQPNGAASSFLSGIVREPLAGLRAVCPVEAHAAVALSSPTRAIEGLLCAHDSSDAAWGSTLALTLPSIALTVGEMVQALERVAGPQASALIDWQPDARIASMVNGWPARVRSDRAAALGLRPDVDFDSVIRDYARESPHAVKMTLRNPG